MATLAVDRPPAALAAVRSLAGPTFRPASALRAGLLALVVGNLGRVPVASIGAKAAPILFNDAVVLAVLAAGLLAGLRARTWRLDALGLLGLAFAAVGALSAILAVPRFGLSGTELVFSLAYLARWLAYFGVYLVAINTLRVADVPAIWRALETMLLVFAGFGIVQALFLPGFAQLVYPESVLYVDWDPQGHRLVSTLLDPNLAGALLVVGLLVVAARISVGAAVPLWKPVILATALVMTLSRGSILAFTVGALVILAARGLSRRVLRVAAVVAVLSLPLVPALLDFARSFAKFDLGASWALKIPVWLRAITVFVDNPVLGVGFNTYGFVQRAYGGVPGGTASYSLDGGLLFIGVMTGIVGLALYVAIIVLVMRRCRRIWRDRSQSAEQRGLAIGVAAATAATLVHSVFANSLLVPFIMEVLWVLWALTFVIRVPRRETAALTRGPVVASFASVLHDPGR